MEIIPFQPFDGQHCETTATGTLLRQLGMEFSEPLLFGLGEGLGFIFWKMKSMDFPFIGGRIKPDVLTRNIARNLQLELTVKETSSPSRAWENVKILLDKGQAVGLKLDCFHLDYFSKPFHFAGHYVAIYGYDKDNAFLVDTRQQGGQVVCSLKSLAKARAEKGPMSSRNLYYTLAKANNKTAIKEVIRMAIRNNATEYIHPPIANLGYKGILKTSNEIGKWFHASKDIRNEFKTAAMLMEQAGTGGALFRNLYRDFLKESYSLLPLKSIKEGWDAFTDIAGLWTAVAQLFDEVAGTEDGKYVQQASEILKILSEKERKVMEVLATI